MAKWKWMAGLGVAAAVGTAAYAQYQGRIEKPAYTVELADGDFELRRYAPMIVAEVTHSGAQENARNAGFRRLAAYIFAEDRPEAGENDKIAMTAPVLQDEPIEMTAPVMRDSPRSGTWRTRFVMPSRYTMETLPTPPSDITLTEMPGRLVAAVRFSGNGRAASLDEQEQRLRDWLQSRERLAAGGAEYAFYDPPMVPGPLRRNEVLIPVE